jgi:DNA helicase HerA-like ATPase
MGTTNDALVAQDARVVCDKNSEFPLPSNVSQGIFAYGGFARLADSRLGNPMPQAAGPLLGHIAHDSSSASNERVVMRTTHQQRARILRNHYVTVADALTPDKTFLGRVIAGPFFPSTSEQLGEILAEIEIQGELVGARTLATDNRPAVGSQVHELSSDRVRALIGLEGDLVLGSLAGRDDLIIGLDSKSKEVLPRNVGIFGTVGSGKSNSVQVLVEEAAACGWAVVLLDLEAEYVDMDKPTSQQHLVERLASYGRTPKGLEDFHVLYPVSCASDRAGSRPFTLRLADFDSSIIGELLQTTMAERNALLDVIDHFQQKFVSQVRTNDAERTKELLDTSPTAKLPYTVQTLRVRANERSPRNSETLDFIGLASKLQLLVNSGAFDCPNMQGLNPAEMLKPGRVTVLDVSVANDTVKNMVTADLLRKSFAYKIAYPEAPPTLIVIEEAHSFMSRERVQAMQATLQMLRNVTRRGRKRWLSLAFVSQQPGHLPPEIFELCNTRLVHTLRSMHNLETLMATTGDVTRELWNHCPMLGTGQAIISTPQFHRSIVATIRPAASNRRFVR